jgi:hypothetical protein
MLNVFITVDVELRIGRATLTPSGLAEAMRAGIYGRTPEGDFGLPFKLRTLNSHGLKGVFFVESLSASALGVDPLRETVDLISGAGQESQLHVHAEWLSLMSEPILAGRTGRNMRDFSEDEQTRLIGAALANFHAASGRRPTAFRAGNYGANFSTLRALARNGIFVDTSYNACYLGDPCDMQTPQPLVRPQYFDDVLELPVTFFEDWPGHMRHAQVGACSFGEMSSMLMQAWRKGWGSFVIVSHSFELMNRARTRADPIATRRFADLCRFLAENRDKFHTCGFAELDSQRFSPEPVSPPLKSNPARTIWRFGEQAVRELYG